MSPKRKQPEPPGADMLFKAMGLFVLFALVLLLLVLNM